MKTKDFIKMLQKEDPTGEGYIRLPDGGAPWFAESKPGYWDGSYQYLEKMNKDDVFNANKRLVISTKGYKVDIHTLKIDSIVWEENGDMKKIRNRIKLDTEYHNEDERSKLFWDGIEDDAKDAKEYDDDFLKREYINMMDEFFYKNSFWEIRQPLDKKIGFYHCMKAFNWFKMPRQLNQGQCDILIRSGKFYPEKKKKYYVWRHDLEKGKNWSLK